MLYYIGLLLFIFIAYSSSNLMADKNKARKIFFVVTCIGVVFFQGFRSFTVGTDLKAYIPGYINIGEMNWRLFEYANFEPGYVVLNKLFYTMGLDARAFLIAIATIVQIPIFYTMYKYSDMPMMSILWYFSFGNFIFTFSGLRQSIAMGLCFSAYALIKEKKAIPFILLIVFSSLFHTSALFCLLLYPLYYTKLNKRMFLATFGFILAIFCFRRQIFSIMSKLYYGEASHITSTGAYTMFIVYVVMFIVAYINSNEADKDYVGLRNILFLLAIVYSFASLHDYVTRIGYPLTLYMTIFVPKVIGNFNITPKRIYHFFCYAILIASFLLFIGDLNTLPFSFG